MNSSTSVGSAPAGANLITDGIEQNSKAFTMNTMTSFPARIKLGSNQNALVYVQSYDKSAKKFLVEWAHSSASIGYFRMDQLHPDGDWHFGENNTLQYGKKPHLTFPNGDPFERSDDGDSLLNAVIIVELTSGFVTAARPFKGVLCDNQLYDSETYQDDILLLCDTDYNGTEVRVTEASDYIVRLQDVVAWQPMPKTLRT